MLSITVVAGVLATCRLGLVIGLLQQIGGIEDQSAVLADNRKASNSIAVTAPAAQTSSARIAV
jgi:hypothetical protein